MSDPRSSLQATQNLIEQSRDGIRIVRDGTVEFVNERLAELIGASKEELVGAPVDEIIAPEIEADPNRLRHLLKNLYRNSIQHWGENVTVTVGGLDDGFYVEDDGPGIPETEREEVLTVGYSMTEKGTGLGLGIVKQVVEAHAWEIRVTSSSYGLR